MNDIYDPILLFKNGHFNTIYTHFFRQVENLPYQREKLTPAHGFSLYLDWLKNKNKSLVILVHGLESSSQARYIQSLGGHFFRHNVDVLGINARGCARGETHEENSYYHSGLTDDLREIINHVLKTTDYESIFIVGYSMGGNVALKYLGEESVKLNSRIKKTVAISTPVDLLSSSYKLASSNGYVYTQVFLKTIREKIKNQTPSIKKLGFNVDQLINCKNLREFDNAFTAPFHGFKNGDDYYKKSSSLHYLNGINIPTLMINAKDDPFLGGSCYPDKKLINNQNLTVLYPNYGGHVGFYTPNSKNLFWNEKKILEFCLF